MDTPTNVYLPPKVYDKLKFLVLILLPAFSTFYFAFGNIWGFPNVEKVIGSVTATELFLGAIIGISAASYKRSDARIDGEIHLGIDGGGISAANLVVPGDPETMLMTRDEITFKVIKPSQ